MNLVNYIYMSILSLCFLTGLINFKSFNLPIKITFLYVVITFVVEMLGFYSLYLSPEKKVNTVLYNIYAPVSLLILSLFFYIIVDSVQIKKVILFLGLLFGLIQVFFIFKNLNTGYNFRVFMGAIVILSIYSIVFFRQILNSGDSFFENPNFWIVTGILFFYTGYFFLSGFINYIATKDAVLARKLFTINHLLNIIYYSLITYGFICQRKLAKSSS